MNLISVSSDFSISLNGLREIHNKQSKQGKQEVVDINLAREISAAEPKKSTIQFRIVKKLKHAQNNAEYPK